MKRFLKYHVEVPKITDKSLHLNPLASCLFSPQSFFQSPESAPSRQTSRTTFATAVTRSSALSVTWLADARVRPGSPARDWAAGATTGARDTPRAPRIRRRPPTARGRPPLARAWIALPRRSVGSSCRCTGGGEPAKGGAGSGARVF